MYSAFAHLINYVLIESILLIMICSNFFLIKLQGKNLVWEFIIEEFIYAYIVKIMNSKCFLKGKVFQFLYRCKGKH